MLKPYSLLLAGLLLPAVLVQTGQAQTIVCFEAEHAPLVQAPMRVTDADRVPINEKTILEAASGGAYLEVPDKAGAPPEVTTGRAVIPFEVPEDGTYILWIRAYWSDECGNSVGIAIDDARPFSFGQDSTYKAWHWVKSPPRIKQLELSKGKHRLEIINREDGVRLDQVLLVNTRRYVPVDIEDVTFTPPTEKP